MGARYAIVVQRDAVLLRPGTGGLVVLGLEVES